MTDGNGSRHCGTDNMLKRALFMAAYGIAAYVALWGLFVLAALQFVFVLIDRKPNEPLRGFSRNLALWLQEIVGFLTFNSDILPFPFAPFPDSARSDIVHRPI